MPASVNRSKKSKKRKKGDEPIEPITGPPSPSTPPPSCAARAATRGSAPPRPDPLLLPRFACGGRRRALSSAAGWAAHGGRGVEQRASSGGRGVERRVSSGSRERERERVRVWLSSRAHMDFYWAGLL